MEKIALITGASGGLGQSVVERLGRDGWSLVLAGRSSRRLAETYSQDHLQVEADCSTRSGAQHLLEETISCLGTPTALLHCAGNIRLGAMHRMKEEDFLDCLNANLVSAFHTLAAFVAALREAQRPGTAVLVSSAAARIGTPNHEAVAAAKAGVEGLVRAAAATYAPNGIRINAVAPGIMTTPATNSLLASPAMRDMAARQYPLPGIGSPEELADLMAWLLSDAATRVTGQVWSLDGGFAAIRPLVK
jgi:NAD(P)-dependent dehydrogenase (short-subunit alcohol dehydrogenase family)